MPLLTPDERLGTLLAGKYRIERILGQGGMGVVFSAVHEWTQRPVAVKLLHPQYASDDDIRQRFLREARTAAKLQHDNVVDVLDMGHEDGAVYLVLEMLDGSPLDGFGQGTTPLPPATVIAAVLPVLDALEAAHDAGIVHRDLKPDNIFLHRKGETVVPKVVDFGIAKIVEGGSNITSTGALIGTPQYMSPEQASGAADLGPQSDVWSMGVVLYELLSGRLPFEAESMMALLLAVATTEPVPLAERAPDLPDALHTLVMRALTPERTARLASITALAEGLRRVAEEAEWDVEKPLSSDWPAILEGEVPPSTTAVSPAPTPRPKTLSAPAFDPTLAATPAPTATPGPISPAPARWRLPVALAVVLLVGVGTALAWPRQDDSEPHETAPSGVVANPTRPAGASAEQTEHAEALPSDAPSLAATPAPPAAPLRDDPPTGGAREAAPTEVQPATPPPSTSAPRRRRHAPTSTPAPAVPPSDDDEPARRGANNALILR